MYWPQSELELINFLSYSMIFWAVIVSLIMVLGKQRAWYGRYGTSGPGFCMIPAKVAWLLQETPAFSIPLIYIWRGECPQLREWDNFIVMVLFLIHYTQRTLIYPLLIRGGKGSSIDIVVMAAAFCACNGFMQGRYHCSYAIYDMGHLWSFLSLAGIMLFFAGFFINVHSDHILRNLRKPGETGYKIPQGGMFNFVSGGNFFGEIVEWVGFAMYAQTLPAIAFAIFTIGNIGPRALHHHEYYKEKFENYPKNRKALIPFLL